MVDGVIPVLVVLVMAVKQIQLTVQLVPVSGVLRPLVVVMTQNLDVLM